MICLARALACAWVLLVLLFLVGWLLVSFFWGNLFSITGSFQFDGQFSFPQRAFRCGILYSSVFSRCSFSPLPCLRFDTVWLVLWLMTVLQGPCQYSSFIGSLLDSPLFRSLTVPLLGSGLLAAVVSPCPRSLRGFCGS